MTKVPSGHKNIELLQASLTFMHVLKYNTSDCVDLDCANVCYDSHIECKLGGQLRQNPNNDYFFFLLQCIFD